MRERAGNSGTSAGNSSLELYVLTVAALNGIRVPIDYVKGTRMTWILRIHTDLCSSNTSPQSFKLVAFEIWLLWQQRLQVRLLHAFQ